MFIIRYFKNTLYSLKGIYSLKDEKFYKVIIYFVLLVIISIMPHNLEIVKEKGFKLGFISEGYNDNNRYELYESSVIKISNTGIKVDDNFTIEVYEFDDFKLVIDYNSEYDIEDGIVLVLKKDYTEYYSKDGSVMKGDYSSFDDEFYFSSLMFDDTTYSTLFTNLEKSFYPYIILFSIVVNVFSNLLMYSIMIILMAILLSFLKYRFSYFLNLKQLCKILVFSMTIPSVVVNVLGLFSTFAFTPVIMNFSMGAISLLVLLKVGKNKLELPVK